MTREEQIKQAAEQFADREYGAMRDVSVFNLLQYAFKCGAEWAVDNYLAQVWHPASEQPKDERFNILCKEDDDHFFMLDNTDWLREEKWEDFTDAFGMTYWADPSDLYPKGNVPSSK